MKTIIFNLFTVSAIVLLMTACKKEETPTATITINEPMANESIANGSSLHVEGSIKGTGELHGYTLVITNKTSGAVIYTGTVNNHSDSYSFHEHWTNNVTSKSNIEVKVEVELDHDGNKTSKIVTCVALP
jgi:hypothetical protein